MSEVKVKENQKDNQEKETKEDKIKTSNKFLYSCGAVFVGLLFGILLLIITGNSVGDYFSNLFNGTFGSLDRFGDFIGTLAWVIPIGLSMVVSFKAGVFNIGSAGQM